MLDDKALTLLEQHTFDLLEKHTIRLGTWKYFAVCFNGDFRFMFLQLVGAFLIIIGGSSALTPVLVVFWVVAILMYPFLGREGAVYAHKVSVVREELRKAKLHAMESIFNTDLFWCDTVELFRETVLSELKEFGFDGFSDDLKEFYTQRVAYYLVDKNFEQINQYGEILKYEGLVSAFMKSHLEFVRSYR